jgi:hypothetical protein
MRRTQQFLSTREGGERDRGGQSVIARTQLYFVVALALTADAYSGFFSLILVFSSSLPNLFEVVQRARPSFNPKGTCPRWAESPAAPGGAKPIYPISKTNWSHVFASGDWRALHSQTQIILMEIDLLHRAQMI